MIPADSAALEQLTRIADALDRINGLIAFVSVWVAVYCADRMVRR